MDKSNYRGLRNYAINSSNPFVKDMVELEIGNKNIVMGSSKSPLINADTGEVEGHSVYVKTKKVDRETFVKIYINKLSSFFELSKAGIRVFSYIASISKPNKDFVFFLVEDCMEFTGYTSRSSVIRGLTELIEYKFIARTPKQFMYFINPSVFFNGDRISFVEDYRISNTKKIEK